MYKILAKADIFIFFLIFKYRCFSRENGCLTEMLICSIISYKLLEFMNDERQLYIVF